MTLTAPPPVLDSGTQALTCYQALAPAYDELTAAYRHDRWLAALERLAVEHGLAGRQVLDVACGTGKSFVPLLDRGYDVTACDISPGMVEVAKARHPEGRVFVADMRELPPFGSYDLVTCLDDAVNYLLDPADLDLALAAMAGALRPGGLLLFDANTLHTYRTAFATDTVSESAERLFCWRGEGDGSPRAGGLNAAMVEVFTRSVDGFWSRVRSHHRQRHHPLSEITDSIARANLERRAVLGQTPGARLHPDPDEDRHTKLVFLAQRPKEDHVIAVP